MDESLILELASIEAIKFGEFKLKSGLVSPFYLDLRILISHPRVLQHVARNLAPLLAPLTFDRIAAIPYAALPIGTALALEMDRPLIYPRREKKEYGTSRAIEGAFNPGETAVVLDDVITTGASKIEAIGPLVAAGLTVKDVVVLIDREQGGVQELQALGFRVHSLAKVTDILPILSQAGRVTQAQHRAVLAFLHK